MKIKIYSILLLLAFSPVIVHDMIPHHHDSCGAVFHVHEQKDNSTQNDGFYAFSHIIHNNHPDCGRFKEGHKPAIPSHSHVSVANSYDYIRRNVSYSSLLNHILAYFYPSECIGLLSTKLWAGGQNIFYNRPLFLNPSIEPGAYGLRAPPAFS